MKTAFVTSRFPHGPPETFLCAELRELQGRFESVIVVPTIPEGDLRRDHFDGEVLSIPLFAPGTLRDALRALRWRPRRALAAVTAVLWGAPAPRSLVRNLAVIPKALAVAWRLRDRGVGHVHAYWLSVPATLAAIVADVLDIGWSATGHRWDIWENNGLAFKTRRARFVRAISERSRSDIILLAGDAPRARVHALHLGVDVPRDQAAFAPGDRPFRMLCAANLIASKGHDTLLEALALARRRGAAVTCDIAGAGPLAASLQKLARELGLADHACFLGQVAHGELLARLSGAVYDAVVLTSVGETQTFKGVSLPTEGIPISLAEAMAAGVPCITTDCGAVRELVDPQSGIVIPPGNAAALADAIGALAADGPRRIALGRHSREKVLRTFDARVTAQRLAALVEAS